MPRSRTSQGLARPIFEVLCRKGLEKEYALSQSVSVFPGILAVLVLRDLLGGS